MEITFSSIGIIHSPFKELAEMPIQPAGAQGIKGSIEIERLYIPALQDLEGFSHFYALYYFHRSRGWKPRVIPFLDIKERGLFSTRAPHRPNPLGLSVFKLEKIEDNLLLISNVDVLEGTPLLDIKPYVPQFDGAQNIRIGWVTEKIDQVNEVRTDRRFVDDNHDEPGQSS